MTRPRERVWLHPGIARSQASQGRSDPSRSFSMPEEMSFMNRRLHAFISAAAAAVPAAALAILLSAFSSSTTRAAICDGISAASDSPVTTVRIASGLVRPCWVTAPPGDTHRIFILEQDGRIRIVKDNVLLGASFLDVSAITRSPSDGGGDEQGLLGLAFSPNYAADGLFFIYHTDVGGTQNLVARYQVSGNPDLADTTTRTLLLTIAHPSNTNHNGGDLIFGPDDGYLYLGTGDGGGSCDTGAGSGNAQNTNELRGKMLRIDVIPAPVPPDPPYPIPPDNPGYPKPEVFSIGLRNPWRYSFDRLTHDLYIADVGQNTQEEVDYRVAANRGNGANYGWQNYEGLLCPAPGCDAVCTPIATRVDPVKVYNHVGGRCSITGGYVYRGCRMPNLASAGRYFYADYCLGNVESFVISGGVVTNEVTYTSQFSPSIGGFTINQVTSWGEDARGEIYIVDRGGEVYKIIPILKNLEVSGVNATSLLLGTPDMTWEDLALNSAYPIEFYRVYRHNGNGSGIFQCVYKTPTVAPPLRPATVWPGGDPAVPAAGGVYSYLVTAVRATDESSPGTGSSGSPRTLGTAVCP